MARVNLTAARVEQFTCEEGQAQAFLWDNQAGFGLRVTKSGSRSFIFQSRFNGQTLRITIGSTADWMIKKARTEAARLQGLIDIGKDPRQEKAVSIATDAAQRDADKLARRRLDVIGTAAWAAYCKDRKRSWSDWSQRDNLAIASAGGVERKRGAGKTDPGPLYGLLKRPLAEIDADAVHQWLKRETTTRPARAALGFRLLRAFINWCADHRDYKSLVHQDACSSTTTRRLIIKSKAKDDVLQREQLAAWFSTVRAASNLVIAGYLQALLLTGARREELMALRWEEVDFRWKSLTIRDKADGQRVIPLTPYVAQLLSALPRRNSWVFSSTAAKSGRLQDPNGNHSKAVAIAGLPHLTLHGLRRSFGTIAEWVECPVGVVAQIQGHKPSAIAEKHYRVRPLDLLRLWHERIEAFMLESAGLEVPTGMETRLKAVTAT